MAFLTSYKVYKVSEERYILFPNNVGIADLIIL
jgi:hypothetical protein